MPKTSKSSKSSRSGKSRSGASSSSGAPSFGHRGIPETFAQLLAKVGTTTELEFLLGEGGIETPTDFSDLARFEADLVPYHEIEEDGETFVEADPVFPTCSGDTEMDLPPNVETDDQIKAFVASTVLRNPYRGTGGKLESQEVFSADHIAHIVGGEGFANDGSNFGWNNLLTSGKIDGPEDGDGDQYKKFAFRGTRAVIAIVWNKKSQFIKVTIKCCREDFKDSYEMDEETGEYILGDDGEKILIASGDDKANAAFEDFLCLMNRETLSTCTSIPASKIVVNKGLGTYTTMSGSKNDLPIAECPDEEGLSDIKEISVVRYVGGADGYYHDDDSAEVIKIGLPGITIQPTDLADPDMHTDIYGLAHIAYQNFLKENPDSESPKLGDMEVEVRGMIMCTMRSFRFNQNPKVNKGKTPTNVSIKNLSLASIVANSPEDIRLIKASRSGGGGGTCGKKAKTKRTRSVRAGW